MIGKRLAGICTAGLLATVAAMAEEYDVALYGGVPCGFAAAVAAKAGQPTQAKLRAQKQVVDSLPGQPEKFKRGPGGYQEF